jgi:hypothetical protein
MRWFPEIAARGIQPAERETYSIGVRKATDRDPDGNEVGFGVPRSHQGSSWPDPALPITLDELDPVAA